MGNIYTKKIGYYNGNSNQSYEKNEVNLKQMSLSSKLLTDSIIKDQYRMEGVRDYQEKESMIVKKNFKQSEIKRTIQPSLDTQLMLQYQQALIIMKKRQLQTIRMLGRVQDGIVVLVKNVIDHKKQAVKIQSLTLDGNCFIQNYDPQNEKKIFERKLMLLNQLNNMKRLNHINASKIYYSFFEGDLFFTVMEECTQNLQEYYHSQKSISQAVWFDIIEQLISGMEHIHSQHQIINDLLLENILITDQQVIKFCDYGLNKFSHTSSHNFQMKGYKFNQPPEIHNLFINSGIYDISLYLEQNQIKQDESSNVWALGMIMLQLLNIKNTDLLGFAMLGNHIPYPYIVSQDTFSFILKVLTREKKQRPTIQQVRELFNERKNIFLSEQELTIIVKQQSENNQSLSSDCKNEKQNYLSTTPSENDENIKELIDFKIMKEDQTLNCIESMNYTEWMNRTESMYSFDSNMYEVIYPSCGIYIGQLNDGMRHGRGTYKYPNGNRYDGEWLDDQQHGEGTFTYHDCDLYHGTFKEGKFSGFGCYLYNWQQQFYYIGFWRNDSWYGQGIFYSIQGEVLKVGYWENSILKTKMKESEIHILECDKHLIQEFKMKIQINQQVVTQFNTQ